MSSIGVFQFASVIITLVTCSLACIGPSLIVDRISPSASSSTVMKYLNCISGGVFAAAFFMMYDVIETEFKNNVSNFWYETFGINAFLTFVGFLLTILLEKGVHKLHTMYFAGGTESHLLDDMGNTLSESESSEVSFHHDANQREEHHHSHEHHHHHHHHEIDFSQINGAKTSPVRFVIILTSLSAHSIFEGITIGLQENLMNFFKLYLSVIIHEVLVALAIGIAMSHQTISKKIKIIISIGFAAIIPVGQAIGFLIVQAPDSPSSSITRSVIQALGVGTFLHVTFMEIISELINEEDMGILHVLFLLVGYMLIPITSMGESLISPHSPVQNST